MPEEKTIAEAVTDRIALQIASGAYRAGEKLPSVRQLAVNYSINASTVQVVLGRLQSAGFVEAHRGIGFLVRDIRLLGGIDTLRYLFRFSAELPTLANTILTDLLATRWTLLSEAIAVLAEGPGIPDSSAVRRAVQQLELLTVHESPVPAAVASAELGVYRTVMATLDRPAALAIINSIEALLTEVPEVLEAAYAFPRAHVAFWNQLIEIWDRGGFTEHVIDDFAKAVRRDDADVVRRFHGLLGHRHGS